MLLAQIISDPCFDTLRTKEQLGLVIHVCCPAEMHVGYIVFSGVRRQNGCHGLRLLVQSDRDAPYLAQRSVSFAASIRVFWDLRFISLTVHRASLSSSPRKSSRRTSLALSPNWFA